MHLSLRNPHDALRYGAELLVVGTLYFLAVRLGLMFGMVADAVSLVWPATGVGIAAVVLRGPRIWPGIAAGLLAAELLAGVPGIFIVAATAGGVLEALTAGWLLRRARFDPAMMRVRDLLVLAVLGLTVATAVSASAGVLGLGLAGMAPWGEFWKAWWPWWMGNATGGLVVAPALLTWGSDPRVHWPKRRWAEGALLLVLLVGASIAAFTAFLSPARLPLGYLPFPLLVWAGARFESRGAAVATLLVTGLALAGTVGGHGPFAMPDLIESMVLLWTFLTVAAITSLMVAAVVAERERAREEVQAGQARYRAIVEDQTELIVRWSPDGTRTFINAAYSRHFQQPPEALVGRSFFDLVIPEDHQGIRDKIAGLSPRNPALTDEHRVIRPDGGVGWQEWTDRGIFDERGRLIEIQSVGRDITDRKHAEEARERLAQAIEQAGEAVIITAPDGTIQYVNPAFEHITGWPREEVLGRNPRILKSGVHDDVFYAALWKTLGEGRVWKGRLVNKRKDGTLYEEDSVISPVFDKAGRVVAFVEIQRDVTQQLRLEALLREAAKLEAVGRLAGGVAHDFNNQLTIIRGYCEELLNDLPPRHAHRKPIEEISRAAEQSARITSQLLAFGRKQTLNPRVVDLNAVLAEIDMTLGRLTGERVDLAIEPGPGPALVEVDPAQLQQAVVNLAINARDAMPTGGRLVLRTARETIRPNGNGPKGAPQPGDYVVLTVSDTGVGMDRETMARVFEPFFTTKAIGKGTGLGLAMVYGFVQQSGGHVSVLSEPGKGTTFRIYLPVAGPIAQAAPEPTPAVEAALRSPQTHTVLLVEDEAALRNLMVRVLSDRGYQVLQAPGGAEALKLAQAHDEPIPLLVTDVVMPGLDGPELARRLRQVRPDTKVLFITGYADRSVLHPPMPGTSLLAKPFSPAMLVQKVQRLLAGAPEPPEDE